MSKANAVEQSGGSQNPNAETDNGPMDFNSLADALDGLDLTVTGDDSPPPPGKGEEDAPDEAPVKADDEEGTDKDSEANAEESSDLSKVESDEEEDEPAASDAEKEDDDPETVRDDDPHGVKKRIGKLSKKIADANDRAEAYKAELEALQAQVANQEQVVVPLSGENRYESVTSLDELNAKQQEAREVLKFCDRKLRECARKGLDEIEETINDKPVSFTVDRLETLRESAQDALDIDLPQRREFLTRRQQVLPEAHKMFPWFKDRSSAEYQAAMSLVKSMPELKRYPDWEVRVGVYMEGLRSIKEKASAAKKPKAAVRAPAQPAAPAASPRKVTTADAHRQKARSRFNEVGDRDSLAAVLESGDF